MSADPQEPSTKATANEAASKASLIATFYGPRPAEPPRDADTTKSLHRQLDDWKYPIAAKKYLQPLINPPGLAAHDTTVAQLGLNAPGDAAAAWETMREQLENILDAQHLQDTWGYSLVYQAVLAEGTDADEVLDELLPAIQRIHLSESQQPSESLQPLEQADMSGGQFVDGAGDRELARLQPLAQADISGGQVWLMAIPDQGDGPAAATVYVALSPPKQEDAFVTEVLYGPEAALLMPDLLAHKVYYHARLYRNDVQDQYEEGLREFRKSTNQLLNDLGEQGVETHGQLKELARKSNGLAIIASGLNELQVLMTRQLHNYELWRARFEGNSIFEYHRERLQGLISELELMVAQGRDALEWCKAAISQAQVQVEKEHERTQRDIDEAQDKRQRRIEALVTVVALALALPHLLEPETTRALLNVLLELRVPDTEPGHLIVLLAQVVIIGIIMAVALLAGFLVMKRRVMAVALLAGFLAVIVLGKRRGPGKRRRRRRLLPFDPS